MPSQRFFTTQSLQEKKALVLEGKEHHHLASVIRVKKGEIVELVNGQGNLSLASVVHIDKKQVHLYIDKNTFTPPPKKKLILGQALPRLPRLDTICEKATELGVNQIILFPSALSEKAALTAHQMDRLNTILINAMKQCGRLHLPELIFSKTAPVSRPLTLFGDVREDAISLKQRAKEIEQAETVCILIGPESGFTQGEIDRFISEGALGVRFSSHILRTDTAAISALTLLSYLINPCI